MSVAGISHCPSIILATFRPPLPSLFYVAWKTLRQEARPHSTKRQKNRPAKHPRSNAANQEFISTMGSIMMTKNRKAIALEGRRLVETAIKAGLRAEKLFVSHGCTENVRKLLEESPPSVMKYYVSRKHMMLWSCTRTPPGIIGIFGKPESIYLKTKHLKESSTVEIPASIFCENIRDPGNLGSIMRTVAAAGFQNIILSKGCVNEWDMKVLRGGCGAHFSLNITSKMESFSRYLTSDEALSLCDDKEKGTTAIFIADSIFKREEEEFGDVIPYMEIDYTQYHKIYLIIGGETEGLSHDTLKMASSSWTPPSSSFVPARRIHIPLQRGIESLNASTALSIVAFEITRQFYLKQRR